MIEEPPFRNRIAIVLATIEARERRRRRAVIAGALAMGLLIVGSLTGIVYFMFVGDQHHEFELRIGDAAFRIVSHTGPFTIEADDRPPDLPIAAGNGGYLNDTVHSRHVVPRSYLWAPIAETRQVVKLPRNETSCRFAVDGIPFHATSARLRTEGRSRVASRQWLAEPGRTVVVDIDKLVAEAEGP